MRSEYINKAELEHVLAALTPPNRLACEISLKTGLRLSDVLTMQTSDIGKTMKIKEQKTGKTRTVYLTKDLVERMLLSCGKYYVFEHRTNPQKHRHRSTVWRDLNRAAKLFRIKINLSPHSCRKIYAVDLLAKTGSVDKVKKALNHNDSDVTILYAFADILTARKYKKKSP